jgi:hypothetical protein
MTALIQICLADTDVNVLAALSMGVIAAIVLASLHEYREARRKRRRLASKHRVHLE